MGAVMRSKDKSLNVVDPSVYPFRHLDLYYPYRIPFPSAVLVLVLLLDPSLSRRCRRQGRHEADE